MGMIHELLLALSGYPGSIFTWNKRSGLQVLSGSERGNWRARNGWTRASAWEEESEGARRRGWQGPRRGGGAYPWTGNLRAVP